MCPRCKEWIREERKNRIAQRVRCLATGWALPSASTWLLVWANAIGRHGAPAGKSSLYRESTRGCGGSRQCDEANRREDRLDQVRANVSVAVLRCISLDAIRGNSRIGSRRMWTSRSYFNGTSTERTTWTTKSRTFSCSRLSSIGEIGATETHRTLLSLLE